jgi:hypothetical protein
MGEWAYLCSRCGYVMVQSSTLEQVAELEKRIPASCNYLLTTDPDDLLLNGILLGQQQLDGVLHGQQQLQSDLQ